MSPTQPISCSGSEAVLDLRQLFERCLGNLPLVDRLISGFRSALADANEQIAGAAQRGENAAVEQRSHRLKGEAANLGAAVIQRVAAALEVAAAAGNGPEISALVGQLAAASDVFRSTAFRFDSLPASSAAGDLASFARLRKGGLT